MSPATDATANVLGALALTIADQINDRAAAACEQTGSTAAALSALAEFLDRPTQEQMRQVLGLTPSGVVRLVDRMVDAGLVARRPGDDARSRSVVLTAKGRRAATRIATARAGYLEQLLGGLSATEAQTLHAILTKVATEVVAAKDGGAWVCRLCDLDACGRAEGRCPTANAAAIKYGTHT